MIYNGLEKEKVNEIHQFVMQKRLETGIGQRNLFRLVKSQFGVEIKEGTISNWIFQGLIPFGSEKTQFKRKPMPPKDELVKLYLEEGISAEKLADKYNVSTIIVINWLREYGVKTRTLTESMNTVDVKNQLRERALIRPMKEFSLLTPAKAYILGVLCGDACIAKKALKLEIRKDIEFTQAFSDSIREVYGLEFSIRYYAKRNVYIVNPSNEIICEDLEKYGNFKTRNWRVPMEIIDSNDEKIMGSYLRGFYDSEGSVSRGAITSSSINEKGLKEVQILLEKLGIKSKFQSYPYTYGTNYVLGIYRKGRFKLFLDKVGFNIDRKRNKIIETLTTGFSTKRSVA